MTSTSSASPIPAGEELSLSRLARREAMLGWMEIAPYGIFTTDAELKIRSWNRWLVTHSGLTEASIVGRPLKAIIPDVVERRLEDYFRRALRGEVTVLSTALHKYLLPLSPATREFDVPYMLQTARVAPLPSGEEIVGTITIVEDVTQRECQARILRRQQEHDRLLSSALAILLQSDAPLDAVTELFPKIAAPLKLEVYFNFLVGPGPNEMRLHSAGGVTPEVRKTLALSYVDGPGPCNAGNLSPQPVTLSHVQANTEPRTEVIRKIGLRSYACFPLLSGERLLGTLAFGSYSRDVIEPDEVNFLSTISQYVAAATDRAQRENALLEARQSLARHAEELEVKIAERTARLEETIQQLESFSYTIAHDLRAPIRSLKGYTEVLFTDYGSLLPAEARAIILRLQRASQRLDALTRDLLKFSKIVREEVQLAPVDLSELIEDILILTPAVQGDILDVRKPLGTVWAQRTLLQQCISNLFDNALKFATPNVKSCIIVRTEMRTEAASAPNTNLPFNRPTTETSRFTRTWNAETPRLRIWIEDNGIGIPEGAHEKIFGIFERVSGLDNVEGTGIGLAIVARAMQQMGGTCGVESTLGQGSRFWLELAAN
ncbi:MAG: ATP-binding protein [Verrucomicrobiota bacterium]